MKAKTENMDTSFKINIWICVTGHLIVSNGVNQCNVSCHDLREKNFAIIEINSLAITNEYHTNFQIILKTFISVQLFMKYVLNNTFLL